MKKISLALSLIMVLTLLLPFSMSATTTVNKIDLTIDAPVVGFKPDMTATAADYSAIPYSVEWHDDTANKFITSNDVFVKDHNYTVSIVCEAQNGFVFATSGTNSAVAVTVNGKSAERGKVINQSYSDHLIAMYTFGKPEQALLTTVDIRNVDAPEVGNTPDYSIGLSSNDTNKWTYDDKVISSYIVNSIVWEDITMFTKLSPTSKFQEDGWYRVTIYLTAKDPYEYGYMKNGLVDVKATVNGQPAEVYPGTNDRKDLVVYYEFSPLSSTVVDEVVLTEKPVEGTPLTSDFFKPSSDKIASVVTTWDDGPGIVPDGTKAAPGKYYSADITFEAASGYKFTHDTIFRVFGGEQMAYQFMENGKYATIMSTIYIECSHKDVTPTYYYDEVQHWKVCNVCDEYIGLEEHKYDKGTPNGATTKYTCTVCGFEKLVDNESSSVSIKLPKFDFNRTFGQICKETIVQMTDGTPSVISFTFKNGNEVNTIMNNQGKWQLPSGGNADSLMNKFPNGFTKYEFTIEVLTNKYITDEVVTVTDPYNEAKNVTKFTREQTYAVVTAEYTTSANYISLIDISGIAQPKVGNKPSTSFNVENEGLDDISIIWSPSDSKFVCGKEYSATLILTASKGYVIAAEQVVEVVGCKDVKASLKNGVLTVVCTYPAMNHTYGGWQTVKEATETETGLQERICSGCGNKETKELAVLEPSHVHTFVQKSDEVGHWTECECGEVTDKEVHIYGEDNKCTICGFENPEKPTEKPTENATEKPTEQPTEKPTESQTQPQTEPSQGLPVWAVILIGVGCAAVAAVIVALIMKKK